MLKPYLLIAVVFLLLGALYSATNLIKEEAARFDPDIFAPQFKEKYRNITLVDPEMAPPDILDKVMHGYRIMINTQKYAEEYAGDKLNCRNCHFRGGNTLGGKNGSISLVGVSYIYPKYSERAKKTISLGERINSCFEKSLNGKPLPLDGDKMEALIAYLDWISSPVRGREDFPWLGLPKIVTDHKPDPEKGKDLYAKHCAACHMPDGQGKYFKEEEETLDIPPLWGSSSFNRRAGMNNVNTMASFVLLNMPKDNPYLNVQEALDVSGFIHNQPRPE
jgi:thiosulfate dehydrogenase